MKTGLPSALPIPSWYPITRRDRQPSRQPPRLPADCREHGVRSMALGAALVALGALFTWMLWQSGYFASVTLLAVGGGLVLIGAGTAAARRELRAREQWQQYCQRRSRILAELRRVQEDGGNPYDWLVANGYTHRGVRKHMLRSLHATNRAAETGTSASA